jgi:hypothetical protein
VLTRFFTRTATVISNSICDKSFGRIFPKSWRLILGEHRQQESNEDEGNIIVVSREIISSRHTGFKYLIFPWSSLLSCCRCCRRIVRPLFGKFRPNRLPYNQFEITVEFLQKICLGIDIFKINLRYFDRHLFCYPLVLTGIFSIFELKNLSWLKLKCW